MEISYEKVAAILDKAKNEIEDDPKYRILSKGIFQEFWEQRSNKKICFCIYLETAAINIINSQLFKKNLKLVEDLLKNNNFLKVNELGEVIEGYYHEGDTNEIKKKLCSLSKTDFVFFFGEKGITKYACGSVIEESNIFFSEEDRRKYLEKKDISKFNEVLHDYATKSLTQQHNYMYFFAEEATLKRIDPCCVKRNILKNKPEHYMRDHLREYLSKHMRYTFVTEPELSQTKRELDIYFDVSGEWHFIEVKWLGTSINNNGDGLSAAYTDNRARQGVTQTLEYIDELLNTSETSLRCGYLAIFDARDKKDEIDFQDFKFVEDNLKKYMQNFKLLNIIPLSKTHSA